MLTTDSGLNPKEVAFHEAAHTVVRYLLGGDFVSVSVVRDGDQAGGVKRIDDPEEDERLYQVRDESSYGGFVEPSEREWIEREIMAALAGGLAEMRLGKAKSALMPGVGADWDRAERFARFATSSQDAALRYCSWLEQRTDDMFDHPACWSAVEAVVEELRLRQTLSRDDVASIVDALQPSLPIRWPPAS